MTAHELARLDGRGTGEVEGMWMTDYTRAIKRKLRDQYGLTPTGGTEDDPVFDNVPDGEYPMEIDGKLPHGAIVGGYFRCCRFERKSMTAHELARKLLDGPDLPVLVGTNFSHCMAEPDTPHVGYAYKSLSTPLAYESLDWHNQPEQLGERVGRFVIMKRTR
jgi:hypothetical protein